MWNSFLTWFADSPLASALRTFVAVVIGAAVSDFAKVGAFSLSNWESWLIGALVISIPPVLRWLNPQDSLGVKVKAG